jgi:cell wall-associated NlpC family hydrolase
MINERAARKLVLRIAFHYLGTFYIWGGDDPSAFDCSGFAIECLKSVGVLPRSGDWTANGLSGRFVGVVEPNPGDLVMWANAEQTRFIHVEICIGRGLSIGASGGGSKTKTIKDAIKQNAFIKVRPIDSRPGPKAYFNPYITEI